MTPVEIATIITALGLGTAVPSIVSALTQRKKAGADATAVVIAAARELVDPLRKELAQERADHSGEIEEERVRVKQLRAELEAASNEAHALRAELNELRSEVHRLRRENAAYRRRIEEADNEE